MSVSMGMDQGVRLPSPLSPESACRQPAATLQDMAPRKDAISIVSSTLFDLTAAGGGEGSGVEWGSAHRFTPPTSGGRT